MRFVKSNVLTYGSEIVACQIDWEGIDLKRRDDRAIQPYAAHFIIETYKNLSSHEDDNAYWNSIYKSINDIFASLSVDDQRVIANFFIDAHTCIIDTLSNDPTMEKVEIVIRQLQMLIIRMSDAINLRRIFTNYVVHGGAITFPDLSEVGGRTQDRSWLTFKYDEYVDLTELSLMSKMMSPIWGELIYRTKNIIETNLKETQFCAILHEYFKQYGTLLEKFFDYIYNIVKSPQDEVTTSFNGQTPNNMVSYVFGTMFVKKFVNVDLLLKECNIMTYVNSCTRQTTSTYLSGLQDRNRANLRLDFSREDDGNASYLEDVSCSTRHTADVPIIVEHATERTIDAMIQSYGISKTIFDRAVAFYLKNPISQTVLNKYIASTMFGHRIGGASGINMLDAITYSKLMAFTQIYMAMHGYTELVHLLTMTPTEIPQPGPVSKTNISIRFNVTSSEEYRNCKNLFPYKIGNLQWDSCLSNIVDTITTYVSYYNTAPAIWDMVDGDAFQNGQQLVYTDSIIRAICGFILHVARYMLQQDDAE